MITVEQATRIIHQYAIDFGTEKAPLHQSTGRILKENLFADRDFPPFDRVSMDGIAIRYEAFAAGRRTFPIEGIQAAGVSMQTLHNTGSCLEVMTGAILPANTDTIIRYEDLVIENHQASIVTDNVQQGQHIHRQGTDRKAGDLIVHEGRLITPAEIGVAATVGKTHLEVARQPKVVVISTGDELVEIGESPLPHQIRKSNVHVLAAILSGWGIKANLLHLHDAPEEIAALLKPCLEEYDTLLLSGGVSMGKFDFLPAVLEELGVQKAFHKVTQRPGKPFWFGTKDRSLVFAFPGNPVSSFVCMHRYFKPWLRASWGLLPFEQHFAALSEDYTFKPDLTYFLQVKLTLQQNGQLLAFPVTGQGSGDLANLTDADAFLELPKERQIFQKGEVFPCWIYR